MRYFAKIHNDHWTAKNNLEKDWKAHCQTQDRIILENPEHRDQYVHHLETALEKLNKKHNRCKPLRWNDYSPLNDHVRFLGVNYVCTIAIWQEQEVQP